MGLKREIMMIPVGSVCEVTECDLRLSQGDFVVLLEDVRKWETHRFDVHDHYSGGQLSFWLSGTDGRTSISIEGAFFGSGSPDCEVDEIRMEGRELHKVWYFILVRFLQKTEGRFLANIVDSSGVNVLCIDVTDGNISYVTP